MDMAGRRERQNNGDKIIRREDDLREEHRGSSFALRATADRSTRIYADREVIKII